MYASLWPIIKIHLLINANVFNQIWSAHLEKMKEAYSVLVKGNIFTMPNDLLTIKRKIDWRNRFIVHLIQGQRAIQSRGLLNEILADKEEEVHIMRNKCWLNTQLEEVKIVLVEKAPSKDSVPERERVLRKLWNFLLTKGTQKKWGWYDTVYIEWWFFVRVKAGGTKECILEHLVILTVVRG